MDWNCFVQLHDRELCYSTKWQRSILSLEIKVDSYKKEAYLFWKPEGKNQVKYVISTQDLYHFSNNIEDKWLYFQHHDKTHKKPIDKIIIYLKTPHHNLVVQSTDYICLGKFRDLMFFMNRGQWYLYNECLRLKFPLDPLQNLRSLKLSHRKISFLPKSLGTLSLQRLFLSDNCLGNTCVEIANWEWMEQTAILQSLKHLDISNNNLAELPLQIGKLQSLIILDVSRNLLTKVPQIIGTLQQLQWLNVSTNRLTYLPGSMRGMDLFRLFTDNNPFRDLHIDEYRSPILKVASLLNLAAKTVKKYRIPYNKLLSTSVRYLNNCKYCCICRNPCFHSDIKVFKLLLDRPTRPINEKRIFGVCQDIKYTNANMRIVFKCYFCSSKCYFYFCKTY